jgi:hypothetical protein
MPPEPWKQAIESWRKLPPEEQKRLRLLHIPRKVSRSMAFEGEPVDQAMLEDALERRGTPPAM